MIKTRDGLTILLKYGSDGRCYSKHDEFYVSQGGGSAGPESMNKEDVEKLIDLGWWWDNEDELWCRDL
jgi:hypothetical protein